MGMFYRTVFLGHDLALFLPDPNWRWAVEVSHRRDTFVEAGKTDRENRAPRRFTMLHELAATWTLKQAPTAELEAQLATLSVPTTGDRVYVGMPMFMDQLTPERWAERIYDSQWVLNYDETGYSIHASNAIPGAAARRWLAPLIVGRLQERPVLKARNNRESQCAMRLLERSPWDFQMKPAAEGVVSADWPAALSDRVNWRELPESATEEIIEYVEMGDGRVEAADDQERNTRRLQRFLLTLQSRAQIRTLLNFFAARKGRVQSFTAPWLLQPGDDTAETPHETRARFSEDVLKLTFTSDAAANAKINLTQVPWEIAGVAGEQPEQAAEAYLYKLIMDVPGGPLVWRYTSWEQDIARPGDGNYSGDLSGWWEHDKITKAFDLSDDPVNLTSWIFDGNPLLRAVQRTLDVALEIEIYKCDPLNPAAAEQVYAGEIGEVRTKSRRLQAATLVLGGRLAVKVPNFFFQPDCNHELCGAGCNTIDADSPGGSMPEEDWTFTGTVVSQVGNELTLTVTSNPPGAALTDEWFAKGWIAKGEGAAHELKQIVRSVDLGGGNQRFTLKRAFVAIAAGDVVTFMPHCFGTKEECQGKFGNYKNFGGHPFIGARNLSIPRRETTPTAGKK